MKIFKFVIIIFFVAIASSQAISADVAKKVVDVTQVAPALISPVAIPVTKTASFKLDIFIPDPLTSTANHDHFQIAYGIRAFNGTDTSGQPTGFQTSSSDMTGNDMDLAILVKVWLVGVEYRPLGHTSKHDTKFYGSSLGGLNITTSNVILGKFYAVDEKKWNISIAYGTELTAIDGSIRMGGFKFQTSGDGWSPVLQLGAEYHLNKNWSLGAVYERSNIRIVTTIPGAPDLVTSRNDRVVVRLGLGLF